jgi:hypothetical protein
MGRFGLAASMDPSEYPTQAFLFDAATSLQSRSSKRSTSRCPLRTRVLLSAPEQFKPLNSLYRGSGRKAIVFESFPPHPTAPRRFNPGTRAKRPGFEPRPSFSAFAFPSHRTLFWRLDLWPPKWTSFDLPSGSWHAVYASRSPTVFTLVFNLTSLFILTSSSSSQIQASSHE